MSDVRGCPTKGPHVPSPMSTSSTGYSVDARCSRFPLLRKPLCGGNKTRRQRRSSYATKRYEYLLSLPCDSHETLDIPSPLEDNMYRGLRP
ncbi:hypothetical protein AB1N83_001632 [Pleurotus pulmonarius]